MVLIAVFLSGACIPKPPVYVDEPVRNDPANGFFSTADRMRQAGLYDKALSRYNMFMHEFPSDPRVPEAILKRAQIYSEMENHSTARSEYQRLVDEYPDSPLVPSAVIGIMSSLYSEAEYDELVNRSGEYWPYLYGDHVAKLNILLGDAQTARGFPALAVDCYTRALKGSGYTEKDGIIEKIRTAAKQLSSSQIRSILDRTGDSPASGYLMFQLGQNNMDEEKYEDAINTLSEFIRIYPDHENAEDANRLIEKIDTIPIYSRHTIGCLLPLSGSYKNYGERALKGIQLALGSAGFRDSSSPINIIIKDTGSDPHKALQALEELVNENVSSIIGPIITCGTVAPKAQKKGIPIITLTPKERITQIGDYVFRNYLTKRMQVRAVVSYAIETLGLRSFAIFYPDEKYGTAFMELFWEEVSSYGGNVTGVEPYNLDQTDFAEPIKKLVGRFYNKSRRKKSIVDFEAVFIPDSPEKAGLIIPQLAFYDVDNVYLLGTRLWHSQRLINMAGKYVQGAIVPEGFIVESSSPKTKKFVDDFMETFGEQPGFMEAVAYDTAEILIELLGMPDIRYRSTLKKELANLHDFMGVTGMTSFDENGEAHKKLYLLRVEGDKFVEIDNR